MDEKHGSSSSPPRARKRCGRFLLFVFIKIRAKDWDSPDVEDFVATPPDARWWTPPRPTEPVGQNPYHANKTQMEEDIAHAESIASPETRLAWDLIEGKTTVAGAVTRIDAIKARLTPQKAAALEEVLIENGLLPAAEEKKEVWVPYLCLLLLS